MQLALFLSLEQLLLAFGIVLGDALHAGNDEDVLEGDFEGLVLEVAPWDLQRQMTD